MRTANFAKLLVVCACLVTASAATGQSQKNETETNSHFDIAVTYDATWSNPLGGGGNFWMQGGSIQPHGQFWHGLGAMADITGVHVGNINSAGVGLDLVTATFGPRYTWLPRRSPLSVYGQALAGEAFGMNSLFPTSNGASDSANSLALVLGGGVNYPFRHHISLRAFEADWVRTQLPNASTNVQNNLRLGAGFVLHLR